MPYRPRLSRIRPIIIVHRTISAMPIVWADWRIKMLMTSIWAAAFLNQNEKRPLILGMTEANPC
jgi:hypothetical protein